MTEPSTDSISAIERKPKKYTPSACGFDRCFYHEEGLSSDEVKLLIKRELEKFETKHETKSGIWVKLVTVLLPFIIGFFVWTSDINSRVAILEHQSIINNEVRNDIRMIRDEITQIRERMIILENKGSN